MSCNKKATSKDWIYLPMRISAKQSRFKDEDVLDNFNRITLDLGCNVEQLNHIFKATDPLDLDAFTGEFMEELHGESIDKYVENAHKNGVKIISYVCVHQLFEKDKKKHPEWLQVRSDGSYALAYGNDYLGCLNTEWADDTVRRIKDLANHAVDGIFLDGPFFTPGCCYCDSCNKLFKKRYGKDIHDSTLREFTEFRVDTLTDFVKRIRETINSVNDNIILYLNNSAVRSDIIGSNAHRLHPYVDIIGAEGGFFMANNDDSVYFTTAFAKDIEDKASGKPTVIFTKAERSPTSYVTHTAVETKRVFAQTVANGANIWYGVHGHTAFVNNAGGVAAKEFFSFLKDNEKYYTKTKNVARVALMWSMPTANYYASSVEASDFTGEHIEGKKSCRSDHRSEYMGFVELLSHNHIAYDAIDDVTLEKKINSYDLVILPSVVAMTENTKRVILEYVKAGGNVLASFQNGVFDEYCEKSDKAFMEELFGIKHEGVSEVDGIGAYMDIPKENFTGIESYSQTPDVRMNISTVTAEALARFYIPGKGRYKELAGLGSPAITKNSYGKGKAILYAGATGEFYLKSNDLATRKIFAEIVNSHAATVFSTDAPRSVEAVLRKQDERYLLHIINHTTDGSRPASENIPVYNLTFDIFLDSKIKSAKALKGEGVTLTEKDGKITVTIDKVVDYSVIALEKA